MRPEFLIWTRIFQQVHVTSRLDLFIATHSVFQTSVAFYEFPEGNKKYWRIRLRSASLSVAAAVARGLRREVVFRPASLCEGSGCAHIRSARGALCQLALLRRALLLARMNTRFHVTTRRASRWQSGPEGRGVAAAVLVRTFGAHELLAHLAAERRVAQLLTTVVIAVI